MKQELEEKLYNEFPLLYGKHSLPISQSCMGFGFEHNDGWFNLIYELSEKLEKLIQKYIDDNPDYDVYPQADQVKEKFGTLRFYMNFYNDEIDKLVTDAENRSEFICERCGGESKGLNDGVWVTNHCDACTTDSKE